MRGAWDSEAPIPVLDLHDLERQPALVLTGGQCKSGDVLMVCVMVRACTGTGGHPPEGLGGRGGRDGG